MSNIFHGRLARWAGCVVAVATLVVLAAGDRGSASEARSGAEKSKASDVALDGYCPVCIVKLKKWVRGKSDIQTTFGGKTYYFPAAKQREMFLADPLKYVPALNGDCTVCFVKMGKLVPGSVKFAAFHQGRLFLFPGPEQKKMFLADPTAFAEADHVSIKGKSGCGTCDHGVVTLGAPDVMSLSVTTPDGTIYIVEDAHKLYPDVYKHRFEELPLAVSGIQLKRDGKIVWIQPTKLESLHKDGTL